MGQADRAVAVGSRSHGLAPWDKTMVGSADMAERRVLVRSTVRPAEEKRVGATLRQVPISKRADAVGPPRARQGPGRSQERGRGARHSPDAACEAQRTGLSDCTRCLAPLPTTTMQRQCQGMSGIGEGNPDRTGTPVTRACRHENEGIIQWAYHWPCENTRAHACRTPSRTPDCTQARKTTRVIPRNAGYAAERDHRDAPARRLLC
ncbi:hypothetical protein V6N12_068358 [Hibiscus sabdariffa]|uniref:Uncharacterized protein n=1 Tax=Hibiscus sabdariffa TaxID=183260 RepID=A0ABR2FPW1_9ROSI